MRCLIVLVMWNVWSRMEKIVDAMSTVCLVDGAAILLGYILNYTAKVTEESARRILGQTSANSMSTKQDLRPRLRNSYRCI